MYILNIFFFEIKFKMSNLNQIEHKDLLFIKTNYENIYKEMEA